MCDFHFAVSFTLIAIQYVIAAQYIAIPKGKNLDDDRAIKSADNKKGKHDEEPVRISLL